MTEKVSVIILTWNQMDITISCVKSVLKQDYNNFEILIVDNGSTDNSIEIFEKEFGKNKKISIYNTKKNIGYAGGNNFGVRHAKGKYYVVLNNDTLVEKDWLKELVKAVKSEKNIGAVSAFEYKYEGEKCINKGLVTNATVLYHEANGKNIKYYKDWDYKETFGLRGGSFIVRKDIANPPFDPEYFIYAEDSYLGWKLRLMGYKNLLSFKAIVHHYHNAVRRKNKQMDKYFSFLGERNHTMNVFLFYERKNLIKILPILIMSKLFINIYKPSKILPRMKAYTWLILNAKKVLKKRKQIQKVRTIGDEKVLSMLSGIFYSEDIIRKPILKKVIRFLNFICLKYCQLVRLKTSEFSNTKS
ncbi:glycosyltransferase family 2 protein [Candidatus Woesearchaeota archaeon]|nr:glycosyltransferase family 2 protein [Candidatus Woesearchaeota archaeon]